LLQVYLTIFLMNYSERSGITGDLIVGAAGFTLVAVVVLAVKYVFRNFTFRKEPTVHSPFDPFGGRSKFAAGFVGAHTMAPAGTPTLAPAPAPAPALQAGDINDETSPVDPSDATPLAAMLASEAVLRRDWDSPEEDEAWAHL
jgi:hypothetical protein